MIDKLLIAFGFIPSPQPTLALRLLAITECKKRQATVVIGTFFGLALVSVFLDLQPIGQVLNLVCLATTTVAGVIGLKLLDKEREAVEAAIKKEQRAMTDK